MHEKMRNGFRKLGNAILALAYKKTVFDPDMKLAPKEDTSDNFDIILETAEKISITRPILPPPVCTHLSKKMEVQCLVMLSDTINCFYPLIRTHASTTVTKKNHNSDMSNLPTWLTFLTDEGNDGDAAVTAEAPPIGDVATDEKEVDNAPIANVKRRLARQDSDYDRAARLFDQPNGRPCDTSPCEEKQASAKQKRLFG